MQTCRRTEWFVSVGLAVIALVVPLPASAGPATERRTSHVGRAATCGQRRPLVVGKCSPAPRRS